MKRILCYGDSNTYGTPPMARLNEDERFGPEVRWPRVMARELGDGFEIIEEGLPGRTTCHPDPLDGAFMDGLAVLPAILKSHKPLDLVIFLLGTNDMKHHFAVTGFGVGAGLRNLALCVPQFAPGARVLIACPPPPFEAGCLAELFAGASERGKSMAHWAAHFASETGSAFFDAGQVISCDPLDGVHYSAEAHKELGKALAARCIEEIGN